MIYSRRLLGEIVDPAAGTAAAVPEGNIWVVRSISAFATGPGVTAAQVIINGITYIWGTTNIAENSSVHWEGRQVLNSGEVLFCTCVGNPVAFCISGYQLPGT